ncbi:hypothetical protein, partial [Chromobacterium subtsugae]|uniref:hypothetical protein n=1 Tax=Chromobacterium subtsugae TaxID=251747 RepID=UPI001C0F4AE7
SKRLHKCIRHLQRVEFDLTNQLANPVDGEIKDQQDPYWSLAAVPACRHQHMHLAQLIQY